MHLHVPLVFHFPEALIFWPVFLWVMYPEQRLMKKYAGDAGEPQDAGTFRLIQYGNSTAMVLAFSLGFVPWLVLPWPRVALVTGTGLVLAAGILRRLCFRALGRYFTGVVKVVKEQPVIDRGPYRWIRHPSYTAGLLLFCGIGLAAGNGLGVAVGVLVPWFIYIRRIRAEEAALLETIGEPYRTYMGRTKRFVPFIW